MLEYYDWKFIALYNHDNLIFVIHWLLGELAFDNELDQIIIHDSIIHNWNFFLLNSLIVTLSTREIYAMSCIDMTTL